MLAIDVPPTQKRGTMSYYRGPPRQEQNLVGFRPENALRRARDMMKVGSVRAACEHLHDVLVSRKMGRYWNVHHEEMMLQFVQLCTDLRETWRCKDGLYFYRQLVQVQAPTSLEKVANSMIELALQKAAEARTRADVDIERVALVDDLEGEEESPEALMMGAVSSDGARERTEREILVPWLRHVWDTYRNVMENVRYVARLEGLYHTVAIKAMGFCKVYNRANEFRRLAALLRGHTIAQRRAQDMNGTEMTTEQVERHIHTRFVQLDFCAELQQWTEAFRTIEDIHAFIEIAAASAKAGAGATATAVTKPAVMACYYEKLARVLWVSDYCLFHAYALYKHYHLTVTQNKALTEDSRRALASTVVLAALAIPVYSATGGDGSGAGVGGEADSTQDRDRKLKLAEMLRQPTVPTREALIADIVSKGVLKAARPDVAALFRALELDFAPLALVSTVAPTIAKLRSEISPAAHVPGSMSASIAGVVAASIGAAGAGLSLGGGAGAGAGAGAAAAEPAVTHTLSQYVPNLERLTVLRVLQQLSTVYASFSLPEFHRLLAPLGLNPLELEKLLVRAVKQRLVAVRLDHRERSLRFAGEGMESPIVRKHLTALATRLHAVVQSVAAGKGTTSPAAAAAGIADPTLAERAASLFQLARETMDMSAAAVAARKEEIERRKEAAERKRQLAEREVRVRVAALPCSPHAHTSRKSAAASRPARSSAVAHRGGRGRARAT